MMEALTSEFYHILGEKAAALSTRDEKRLLRFELVSAKGLYIESSDNIIKAQLHIIFRKEVVRSSEVVVSSLTASDVVFNFTAEFNVNDLDFNDLSSIGDSECPVLIFLTTSTPISSSSRTEDSLPVGILHSRTLRAMALIDCRLACMHSSSYMSIELMPTDLDGVISNGATAGLLYMHMSVVENEIVQDILVQQPGGSDPIDFTSSLINRYQSKLSSASSENYLRAKAWWTAIRRDFPWIESRDIKLVANDECGQQRFVCAFIGPIDPPRWVNSPREAARFVSLIPFARTIGIAGGRGSKWRSPFGLLTALQGDVEDHAILLCSLLLGWGMDAWVVMGTILVPNSSDADATNAASNQNLDPTNIGTASTSVKLDKQKKPHWWVVTFDSVSDHRVVFWESLTGQQYDILLDATQRGCFVKPIQIGTTTSSKGGSSTATTAIHQSALAAIVTDSMETHPFCEVFALFRSDMFILNTQKHPNVRPLSFAAGSPAQQQQGQTSATASISFDISDAKYWVKFPFHESDVLRHPGCRLVLSRGPILSQDMQIFVGDTEDRMENALMKMIGSWREEQGLQTHFDESIARILQPALVAYELDRAQAGNIVNGTSDFQCSVRKLVKRGECFKAYPTCFSHCHIPHILQVLSKTGIVRDIVGARSVTPLDQAGGWIGQHSLTKHGVRVKMFMYPEGICAVWVMIAVTYFDKVK